MLPYWDHLPNSTLDPRRTRLTLWKKKQTHNQTSFVIYKVEAAATFSRINYFILLSNQGCVTFPIPFEKQVSINRYTHGQSQASKWLISQTGILMSSFSLM